MFGPLYDGRVVADDFGSRPGDATWGPYLTVNDKTKEQQRDWQRAHPIEARNWDDASDRRYASWCDSPFAAAVNRLFRIPYHRHVSDRSGD